MFDLQAEEVEQPEVSTFPDRPAQYSRVIAGDSDSTVDITGFSSIGDPRDERLHKIDVASPHCDVKSGVASADGVWVGPCVEKEACYLSVSAMSGLDECTRPGGRR